VILAWGMMEGDTSTCSRKKSEICSGTMVWDDTFDASSPDAQTAIYVTKNNQRFYSNSFPPITSLLINIHNSSDIIIIYLFFLNIYCYYVDMCISLLIESVSAFGKYYGIGAK
jgi:hypothetical protein